MQSQMDADKASAVIALIDSGKSQRAACAEIGVGEATFRLWKDNDPVLATQYTRACEARGLLLAEEALEIADNLEIPSDHKRLMLDQRKWFSSKLNRGLLGDKIAAEVSGPNGEAVEIKWKD